MGPREVRDCEGWFTDDIQPVLDIPVVEVNQGLSTRARVTDRIRATALGQYVQSAYMKEMGSEERPELDLNQRRR